MRMSTSLLPNTVLLLAMTAAQVLGSAYARAQDEGVVPASYTAGSFFSRDLDTALRFNYHTQGYGTQDGVFSLGGMKVIDMEGASVFFDGQGTMSDDFGGGYNLGVGYRQLTTLGTSFDPQRILGASLWHDGQSSANDNFFAQLGFSLESLGEVYDWRFSGYFPLEREKAGDGVVNGSGTTSYVGNSLFGMTEARAIDTALDVLDTELAFRIADLEAWAFAGAYYLGGGEDDTGGYRVGVRGYAVPDLAVSFAVTEDDIYDANFLFNITWFIGRTHKGNAPCGTIVDRFREPVLRNDFIAMTSRQEDVGTGQELLLDGSGDPVRIVHVDSAAAAGGDGTFENPYNTLTLVDNAGNSAPSDIILVHGGSSFAGGAGQIALQENQRLLGEGIDQNGNTITHFVATNVGNVALAETAAGAQALMRPQIDASSIAGSVIEMADGTAVDNFTISAADTAISANGIAAATGNTVANVLIENPTVAGVALTNVTGTATLDSNVVISGASGTGLLIDGGSESIAMLGSINDTTGATANSLVVRNRTGGAVTFTGTIDDDTAMANTNTSAGVLIENNADSTVTFDSTGSLNVRVDDPLAAAFTVQNNTNTTVNANGPADLTADMDAQGLLITGNDVNSSVSFADLNATALNGDTVSVAGGGNVTLSSAATRAIANTGTGVAFRNVGDLADADLNAAITVNSDITNSGGGEAVNVINRIANNVTFTGTVDTTTNGGGIFAQNISAGTLLFSNTLTLNTGTSDGVNLVGNTGATLSFADLSIETTNGDGFVATGGGTLLVTSLNGTNSINVTGTGTGVNLDGMTIDAGNVTFDSVDVGNGAGNGINLANLDGGTVNIGGGTAAGGGGVLNTAGTAININDVENVAFTNVSVGSAMTANAGQGVNITNQMTGSTATFNTLTVNTSGAALGISANANVDGTIDINGLNVTTENGIAVQAINNGTATTTITDTNLVATGSTTGIGLQASGTGTLTIDGTNTVMTNNGRAIDVSNTTLGAGGVTFDTVDVTAGLGNGVNLATVDGGTVTLGSGSNPGDGGTLVTADTAIVVDNVSSLVTNNITIDNDMSAGAGVNVTNQVAASTATFNGLTVESGAQDAFTASGNAATANVSLSDLDATTTGGIGVNVDGGNFQATGSNTVMTTTGTGVSLQNANITATTTFDSVDVTMGTGNGVLTNNLTGSQVAVNGGTLTTDGTAVSVTNSDNVAISGVTVNNGTSNGNGVVASNSAGDTLALANVAVTSGTGSGVDVNGGNFQATGTNTITTTTGQGLSLQNAAINAANDALFASVDVNGAANGITLNNLTGGQVRVGAATATGTDGDGGELVTTGTAITVTGVTDAVFNDVTVDADSDGSGDDAVVVTHTSASLSDVIFDNLELTTIAGAGDGLVVTDSGTGELDVIVRNSSIDSTASNTVGLRVTANDNTGRLDVTILDNVIAATDSQALFADLAQGTGDVQFLVNDNTISNNSATVAAADFSLAAGRTLNAVIGDGTPDAPFDANTFTNANGGGTGFFMETSNAAGVINLDLQDNTATGGALDFQLSEALGGSDFNIVDRAGTITTPVNNTGAFDLNGRADTDFDSITGPVSQPN